ncbi:MAG: hypothetical protein O3B65_01810 [Chloroflexi bacterium]|nr:hypothetical protein [Chloroflexota bacterium]
MQAWSPTVLRSQAATRSAVQASEERKACGLMPEGWFGLIIFHDSELDGVLSILKTLSAMPILDVRRAETNRTWE